MILLLNGPLGVGKSTLAEALMERVDGCAMLDGDRLVALNPPPADEGAYLHATIALLVAHHRRAGYRHFVVDHLWRTRASLDDLRRRLCDADPIAEIHCLLLTLPLEENLRRIARRQAARALDERDFERRIVAEERAILYDGERRELGEPFDVSDPPGLLVDRIVGRFAFP